MAECALLLHKDQVIFLEKTVKDLNVQFGSQAEEH